MRERRVETGLPDRGSLPNGNAANIGRVNENIERDPFNTAVAAVLTDLVDGDETGMMRLSRVTGIPRSTLRRYLDGQRDIKVSALRKIADAIHEPIADIFAEAQRRVQ